MALSPQYAHSFTSPKRKRGHEDSSPYDPHISPSKSRTADTFRRHPLLLAQQASNEDLQPFSSQSTVKFQNLALRGSALPIEHDRKRPATMKADVSADTGNPTSLAKQSQPDDASNQDTLPPSTPTFDFEAASMIESDKPRRQSRSPPLDGQQQDNFWHDSEITGHNPTDPMDDGYGINGIGFKPTPAMAWARSQKRKQQLADYKSRETREARQRRIERRRVSSNLESERGNEDGGSLQNNQRVRFEDG